MLCGGAKQPVRKINHARRSDRAGKPPQWTWRIAESTSKFRVAVAGPAARRLMLLAAIAVRLAPKLADASTATATALAALGAATLTTGVALLILGAL